MNYKPVKNDTQTPITPYEGSWAEQQTRARREAWNNTPLMQRTMRESGIVDVEDDANDEPAF